MVTKCRSTDLSSLASKPWKFISSKITFTKLTQTKFFTILDKSYAHCFSTAVMFLMTEISHAHLDPSNSDCLPSLIQVKKKTVILYEAQLLLIVQISAK